MEIINNNTVVVFTSEELKSVLESDNTYTYIYIGSDIKIQDSYSSGNEVAEVNKIEIGGNQQSIINLQVTQDFGLENLILILKY